MIDLSGSLFIIVSIVLGQLIIASGQLSLPQPSSEDDLVKLQQTQRQERSCFMKLDRHYVKSWEGGLNETDVDGVDSILEYWSETSNERNISKPKYNTQTEQWLMDNENPHWKLVECSAHLFAIKDSIEKETAECADDLFKKLLDQDEAETDINVALLNNKKDLPFHQFFSFSDLKELLFQNRSVDNLTNHEQGVYGHMESFVPLDEDKKEKAWILLQECNWEDLEELRNAKDDKHMFELFKNQVIRSVDYNLGNRLVQNIDLSVNISHANYTAWVEARKNMLTEIDTIVGKLSSVKNDSQWICEYANEIANKFAEEQEALLLSHTFYRINLKTDDIVTKARALVEKFERRNDTRIGNLKDLVEKVENRMHCWTSVINKLENQQRYELTKHFISNNLSYSQTYCRQMNINLGLLAPHYCKCVGSLCVQHSISALFAERFELTKNETSGSYRVVTKNVNRPTKKVVAWPGVKEI